MSVFRYKAKKSTGDVVEGTLTAADETDVIDKLVKQNLFAVEVEICDSLERIIPARHIRSEKVFTSIFQKLSRKKISRKEVLVFTRKLATLSRAKIELLTSLKILYGQMDNPAFKQVILKVCALIEEGDSFSQALGRFEGVFSSLFVSIVKAGEVSGTMDAALTQIIYFMQTRENLKNKVLRALIYPAILLCVGVMSIFVIMNFVIPKLKDIFEGLGSNLPLITKVILRISDFSTKNWLSAFFVLAAVSVIIFYKGSKVFSGYFKWLMERLPVISRLLKNQELANFAMALHLLISSGVTPLQSLEIAGLSVGDARMRRKLKEAAEKIKNGQAMYESMAVVKSFPDFFIKMIAIGEESGRLGEVLNEIADSYVQEIESDTAVIASVLEPLFILALGVVLGGIVIAMLLPIFQITQFIQ